MHRLPHLTGNRCFVIYLIFLVNFHATAYSLSYPIVAAISDYGCAIRKVDLSTWQVTTLFMPIGGVSSTQDCQLEKPPGTNYFLMTIQYGIYRVDLPGGGRTLIAGDGGGTTTAVDGVGTAAKFSSISSIKMSPDGTYALIGTERAIRKMMMSNYAVTTLTGTLSDTYSEGIGSGINLKMCGGIDISADGSFAIFSEAVGNRIRKLMLSTLQSSLVAGSVTGASNGCIDGVGSSAGICMPRAVLISSDQQYVYVTAYACLRKITLATQEVVTIRSGSMSSSDPMNPALAMIWLSPTTALTGARYSLTSLDLVSGGVTTSAGAISSPGITDGNGGAARFSYTSGITLISSCDTAGYVYSNGLCSQCPANTFASSGACVACPAHMSSDPGSTSCIANAGYYMNGGSPVSCGTTGCNPPNTYVQCTTDGSVVCCGAGTYWVQSTSTCTNCPVGTYGSGSDVRCNSCLNACSPGYRKVSECTASSDKICASCVSGSTFSTTSDSATCNTCSTCLPGQFASATCTLTSDTVCQACSTCSGDSYTAVQCSAASDTVCLCRPGFYMNAGTCTECTGTCASGTKHCLPNGGMVCCSPGTYFVEGSSTACKTCASGTYSDGGATACTKCTGGLNSPPGSSACNASYSVQLYIGDSYCAVRKIDMGTGKVVTVSPAISGLIFNSCFLTVPTSGDFLLAAIGYGVYKIFLSNGTSTVFAGGWGTYGAYNDGVGTDVIFSGIMDMKQSKDGTYAIIYDSYSIRKMYIGNRSVISLTSHSGTYSEGTGDAIGINGGMGSLDLAGSGKFIVFTEPAKHIVRMIDLTKTPVVSSCIAGKYNQAGYEDNSIGTSAFFNIPLGVSISPDETFVLVVDTAHRRIRKISMIAPYAVTTVVVNVNYCSGYVYVISSNSALVTITNAIYNLDLLSGTFTLVAGGNSGMVDGIGSAASFQHLKSITPFSRGCLLPGYGITSDGSCSKCSAGTASAGNGQCISCPANTVPPVDSTSCIPYPGYYIDSISGTVATCGTGCSPPTTFAQCASTGQVVCCGTGTYWVPSSTVSGCTQCATGTYGIGNDTSCSTCPATTFSGSSGSSSCSACSAGTSSVPGSSACVSSIAPVGQYFSTVTGTFVSCSSGYFCLGDIAGPQACSICGVGSFLLSSCTSSADTVCSACSTCAAGTYKKAECTLTSDTVCQACSTCSSNSYSVTSCSATNDTVCLCSPGFYMNSGTCTACSGTCSTGTKRCDPAGASVCCAGGTYFVEGSSTACQRCVQGTYTANGSATACTNCASGLNAYAGSSICLASYKINVFVTDQGARSVQSFALGAKTTPVTFSTNSYPINSLSISNTLDFYMFVSTGAVFIAYAPDYIPSTLAGKPGSYGSDNGIGQSARFEFVQDVSVSVDNTYALVSEPGRIRKVYLNGTVTAFAGPLVYETYGYQEGTGTSIRFYTPASICMSPSGDFALVLDTGYHRLRKLTLTGDVGTSSLIAGAGTTGSIVDGIGLAAKFSNPTRVIISSDSTYALVLEIDGPVRKVVLSTQAVTTVFSVAFTSSGFDITGLSDFIVFSDFVSKIFTVKTYPAGDPVYSSDVLFNTPKGLQIQKCRLTGYGYNTSFYCSQCPLNTYGPGNGTCLPCSGGLASPPGSTSCTTGAPAGTYFGSGGSVTACPGGSFCVGGFSGAQTCSACAAGLFVISACTSSADTVCGACTAGVNYTTAVNSVACSPCTATCAAGFYKIAASCTLTSDTVCQACTSCSGGSYSVTSCSATNDTVCLCSQGFYMNAGTCTACSGTCATGTKHCNPSGTLSCCGPGTYFTEGISTACQVCASGTFGTGNATACTKCAGKLSSPPGSDTCSSSYSVKILAGDAYCAIRSVDLSSGSMTTVVPKLPQGTYWKCFVVGPGNGNFLLASYDYSIYKMFPSNGSSVLFAGGIYGTSDGIGTAARLKNLFDIAWSELGQFALLREETSIRKLYLSNASVITLTGQSLPYAEGTGSSIGVSSGYIAVSVSGKFAIFTESNQNRIRKLDMTTPTAVSSLIAGDVSGTSGDTDSSIGTSARFTAPTGVTISSDDTFALVLDKGGARLRKISLSFPHEVTTLISSFGTGNSMHKLYFTGASSALLVNSISIYNLDLISNSVTKLAGFYSYGGTDGSASAASFAGLASLIPAGSNCFMAGYGISNSQCTQCPSSMYGAGNGQCFSCAANTASSAGSSACVPNPGYFIDSATGTAVTCSSGCNPPTTFAQCTSTGQVVCCGAGTYWVPSSSVSGCTQCGAGTYGSGNDTACSACPATTFSGTTGSSSCSACSVGTSSSAGSSVCVSSIAPAGQYFSTLTGSFVSCAGGYFCPGGSIVPQVCSICGAGSFVLSNCTSLADTVCGTCKVGVNYSTSANALACTPCTPCTPGQFVSTACTATSDSVCGACVAGVNYSTTVNAAACIACGTCAPGQYASTACSVTANLTCSVCPAGSYCPNASAVITCDPGKVCLAGSSSQSQCPAGFVCATPATQVACQQSYFCPAGTTSAVKCAAGSFCANTSSQITCASGSYCPLGSTNQTLCSTGFMCPTPSDSLTCENVTTTLNIYPPGKYTSATSAVAVSFNGRPAFYEKLILSSFLYGDGTYNLYCSSQNTYGPKSNLVDGSVYTGAVWDNNLYDSSGIYIGSNYLVNGYTGDWIVIEFPVPILFTGFNIYAATTFNAPGEWKVYGSTDGISFLEITQASSTTKLTDSDFVVTEVSPDAVVYKKRFQATSTAYRFIGFTFHRLVGNWRTLGIVEMSFFAQGQLISPANPGQAAYCPAGSTGKTLCQAGFFCPNASYALPCWTPNYCPIGSPAQTICPASYFCSTTANKTQCSSCMLGQYTSSPCTFTSDLSCAECPSGSFCSSPSITSPVACGLTYYCPPSSISKSLCMQGYMCPNASVQIACTSPNYCPTGTTSQQPCAVGYYCPNTYTQTACSASNFCPAGSTSQQLCALGFFCPNTSVQLPCSTPNFCPQGSTSQKPCAKGFYCPNASAQLECPPNNYCPTGVTSPNPCTSCSSGQYIKSLCNATDNIVCPACTGLPTNAAFTGVGSAQDNCPWFCLGGYYLFGGNQCNECLAGYWCNADVLNECPSNANSSTKSSDQNSCLCKPGYFGNGSVSGTSPCPVCHEGFYCPGGNGNITVQCPANMSSPIGSSSFSDCQCIPGYLRTSDTSCALCGKGQICLSGALSSCPANSVAPEGSSSVEACVCKPGFFGPNGGPCVACPANSYCTGGNAATPCTAHAVSPVQSVNSTECYCDRGYKGIANAACESCEANTWCWTGILNLCPANTSSPVLSSYPDNCTCNPGFTGPHSACSSCAPGTYKSIGGSAPCTECPANNFCPIESATPTPCPLADSNSPKGSISVLNCQCNPGFYGPSCQPCPIASFCPGGPSAIRCPNDGYTAALGAIAASECLCPAKAALNSSTNVCECIPGYKHIVDSNESAGWRCDPCPLNSYCNNGLEIQCPVGSTTLLTASNSSSDCLCSDGHYMSSGACLTCDYGTYAAKGTVKRCNTCPMNSNTSGIGSSLIAECLCQAGYSGDTGNQAELPLPVNLVRTCYNSLCAVAASSSYYGDQFAPDKAVDNNLMSFWHSNDRVIPSGTYNWWRMDFITSRVFTGGFITNRNGIYGRMNHYQIWIGDDPIFPGTNKMAYYSPNVDIVKESFKSVGEGRYFYVASNITDEYFQMAELEIYGIFIDSCKACAKNSYCPGNRVNYTIPCPNSTYSVAGSSSESQCVCPPNSAWLPGSNCTCNNGTYTVNNSALALAGWQCNPCVGGRYCQLGYSMACPATYYCPVSSSDPIKCSDGFFCPPSSPTPLPCPSGSFCKSGAPTLCPAGSFCPVSSSAPTPCPFGSYTSPVGSNTSSDCLCDDGYYMSGGACLLCGYGSYSAKGKVGACDQCPANSNTTVQGSKALSDCLCKAKYYGDPQTPPGTVPPFSLLKTCGNSLCSTAALDSYWSPDTYIYWSSERAVDGSTSTPYMSGGPRPVGGYNWWRMDFLTPRMFTGGLITNYHIYPGRMSHFQIWIGNDVNFPGTNKLVYYSPNENMMQETFQSVGTGRYFYVASNTGDFLQIAEIDIYGTEQMPNCVACAAGSYCPGGKANYTLQCPNSTFSPAGSSSLSQCTCPPNSVWLPELNCSCINGTYKTPTPPSMTICGEGLQCSYSVTRGYDSSYYPFSNVFNDIPCSGTITNQAAWTAVIDLGQNYENLIISFMWGQSWTDGVTCSHGASDRTNGMVISVGTTSSNGVSCYTPPADMVVGAYPTSYTIAGSCNGTSGRYVTIANSNSVFFSLWKLRIQLASSLTFPFQCNLCRGGSFCLSGLSTTCPIGFYCPPFSTAPIPCPSGLLCSTSSAFPAACPNGNSCVGGIATVCPAGSFCTANSSAPTPCPPGSYTEPGAAAPIICPSGSVCINGTKNPCPAGSFCPTNSSVPTPCPPGSYTNPGASAPIICPSGSVCVDGAKNPCPAGSFCLANTSVPTPCPPGSYTEPGASAPVVCPSGSVCVDGAKNPCPAGSFCPFANTSVPTPCPLGSYAEPGATAPTICPMGSLCLNGTVGECPPGTICVTGATSAAACPPNSFCLPNSTEPLPCPAGSVCKNGLKVDCPPGSTCKGGNASLCPIGFVCDGFSDPIACPINTNTTETGASNVSQCLCNPGYEASRNCAPCTAGFYCASRGIAVFCPPGNYCPTGSSSPTPCAKESYSSYPGAARCSLCTACVSGFRETAPCTPTSYRECVPCTGAPANTIYLPTCEWVCAGGYRSQGSLCTGCTAGYWCNGGVMNQCPLNSYSSSLSSSQDNCTCNPGFTTVSGDCVECTAGVICPGGGALSVQMTSAPQPDVAAQIMIVQQSIPPSKNLVSLLQSVPVNYAKLKASVPSNITVVTRQVCRKDVSGSATYCIACNGSPKCVSTVWVAVKRATTGGKYTFNVSSVPLNTLIIFVPSTAGMCTPVISLPSEYVTGLTVAVPLAAKRGSIPVTCPSNNAIGSNLTVEGGTSPTAARRRRLLNDADERKSRRKLLQEESDDELVISIVVPSNLTTTVQEAVAQANLTVQGYVPITPANRDVVVVPVNSTADIPVVLEKPCPENSTSPSGTTKQSQCVCLPGYEGDAASGTPCSPCQPGVFCSGGLLGLCPANSTAPAMSNSSADCKCNPGFYGSGCKECPANSYCPGGGEIFACGPSFTSPPQSSKSSACYCLPGFLASGNECVPCPAGRWCLTGISNACPFGMTSTTGSAGAVSACVCADGYAGSPCTICPANTLCKMLHQNHFFVLFLFLLAPQASLAFSCDPGQYTTDNTTCLTCLADSFCQGGVMTECPKYSVSPPGSSTQDQCVCPPNAYINNDLCICNDGYLLKPEGGCELCPANAYCPDQNTIVNCTNHALSSPGQVSATGCNRCPSGYAQNSPTDSPISCRPCKPGYACPSVLVETKCLAGTFSPYLGTACETCPSNSYSPDAASACTECSAHASSPSGAKSVSECVCEDGYYMDYYSVCQECQAGSACTNNQKTVCAPGSFSDIKQNNCTLCVPGTYQDSAGSSICKTCPGGSKIQFSTTGSDLQSLGVIIRAYLDSQTRGLIYIQGAQNYLIQAQGANITSWSFYAAAVTCVVTPVILGGSYSSPTGKYTFDVLRVGSTRTVLTTGPHTFPFDDSGTHFTVPVVDYLAPPPYRFTYFGWYFADAPCIPFDMVVSPVAAPVYVWSFEYTPGVTTQLERPAGMPFGDAMFWSVSVTSTSTKWMLASAEGTRNVTGCTCPDGTRLLPSGVCQPRCPNGQYIPAITGTECVPCAQGSYCIDSVITPCHIGTSSLPGSTSCSPCITPGQNTNIQLYTCGLLKTCTPNTPVPIDANGWVGVGTVVAGTGGINVSTPWAPNAPILGLQLNPASDRPFAMIQKDFYVEPNSIVAMRLYFRCDGVACPDWLVVDYSQDGAENFVTVLNISTWDQSSWTQIATDFFQIVTLLPTRVRIYTQMTLRSSIVWLGNVQVVNIGAWQYDVYGSVSLRTTETVNVSRFPDGVGTYQQPVEAAKLSVTADRIYLDLSSTYASLIYPQYAYVASVWASGTGTITLSSNDVDTMTWTVGETMKLYQITTTQTPTVFSIMADETLTIKRPSLTLRSKVVGCQTCLENYFCPTPTPVPCAPNSWSPAGSNASTQCVCNAGYWGLPGTIDALGHADSCKPCPLGHYCPGGALPIVCPNGTITTELGQTTCLPCNASDYCALGTMWGCPPNSMSPTRSWDVTQCICNPGFYGVAPDCKICEQGFYCFNGAKTACTTNAVSPPMSSTSDACYCSGGYYGLRNAECTPCPESHYCRLGLINPCPPSMWSANQSSVISNCSCDFGFYPVLATCSACGAGSYKSARGPGICTTCSAGSYSATRGAVSSAACIGCAPGTYGVSVGMYQCQACAAGTYASAPGSASCAACWAGAYATLGASVCSLCAAGTYSSIEAAPSVAACKTCDAGQWAVANSSACTLCGACSYWKYPAAVFFTPGSLSTVTSDPTQQHYAFTLRNFNNNYVVYIAQGTSIHTIDLTTKTLSAPLVFEGPSTEPWWYNSISASSMGNYLYAIQNQRAFRIDLTMGKYDLIYSSNLATCIVEDSTQPRTVLWIVQPSGVRQVDPLGALDIVDYSVSGAFYACVNPQDPDNLYITGSFGLMRLNKITGVFTTLKTGSAYTICQVTPDGNFVVMAQTAPKVIVAFNIFDKKTTVNVVANAAVSGMLVDSTGVVLGVDLMGIVNVSYTYADSRTCTPGAFSENAGNTDPSQCTVCPKGNLCPGGTVVSACAPGSYSNYTGLREQAQCMVCPKGSFCPGAVCNQPSGCSISPATGVCTGILCDATNSIQTCPPGSYSPFTGLMRGADCPLCVNGFYCPDPLTQLMCPNNTWSPPGSQDLSACACLPGYRCIITKIVHAQVILNIQYSDFLSSKTLQDAYIAAIAAAAGVSLSQVSIQGIFTYTAPPSGRRLLQDSRRKMLRAFVSATDIHTLIRSQELCDLNNLNEHLTLQGLPSHRGVTVSLHNEVIQTFRSASG